MSVSRQNTNSVKDVNPQSENWILIARVIRLWFVSDFKKTKFPFSMEMVIQDKDGDRIHVSVRRTLIYKFQNDIFEDKVYSFNFFSVSTNSGSYRTTCHQYKINFQFGTKVTSIDVIGILTGVGTERELNRSGSPTKLNAISIEADGYRIECTLFGNYVDELNAFLSSGKLENIVISVHFAKVKIFQDKESTFVILATIKHIVADDDWWYTACLCGKAVYPDSKMYKLKLRVIDETDSTTFVLFDRDATTLINKSCAELFESHDKNDDSGVLPKNFDLLIDKAVLFKVGCVKDQSLRFDQSFRVKKVCIDDSTIQRFCEGRVENVEFHSQKKRLCTIKDVQQDESSVPLSRELFNKFSTEAAELQSKTIDLGSDSVLGTATEFVAPRVTRDFASPAHTPDDDIPLKAFFNFYVEHVMMY
ncbi:uncharacterized protein [Phaseolus vulgaris]|uniref:uncharacterized protein n=1 Tax=Phaseolus vulgaris TaxID=3885 RepID=UPI0035CB4324